MDLVIDLFTKASHILPQLPPIPTTLPPPIFGNPSPLITHIGTPIPPGANLGFSSNVAKRSSSSDKQLAIELSDYSESDALEADFNHQNQTVIQWPS